MRHPRSRRKRGGASTKSHEIDTLFARYQADQHIPGIVYGIVQDGKLVYLKGRGVEDVTTNAGRWRSTLFRIASTNKAFTALAVLNLRDPEQAAARRSGRRLCPRNEALDLSHPRMIRAHSAVDLLTMSPGFVADDPWGDRQQILSPDDFREDVGRPPASVPHGRREAAFDIRLRLCAARPHPLANASRCLCRLCPHHHPPPAGDEGQRLSVTRAPRRAAIARAAIAGKVRRGCPDAEMVDGAFNGMGELQVSAKVITKWVAFLRIGTACATTPTRARSRRATVARSRRA